MAVTGRTLGLADALADQLDLILDRHTRALVLAWAVAWDEVSVDLHDALLDLTAAGDRITPAMVRRSRRLSRALAVVADRLDDLARQTGVIVAGDLAAVVEQAADAQQAIIDSQLPIALGAGSWELVNPDALEAIVARTLEQITSALKPLSDEALAVMRRELVRGVAAGLNPRDTAARIVRRTEGHFNGGLTRALTVARTEMLDAHREAAQVARQANADVVAGWRWLATLDPRTCPACWAKHGSEHAASAPGPLGHQQCRCAAVPVTRSWAELGFDGMDEPDDLMPDAEATFRRMSAADQRRVLGPRRYDLWRAGRFPMSRWATRRSVQGWRDSYVVSRVGR